MKVVKEKITENIPTPTTNEVERWLCKWKLPDDGKYEHQEKAVAEVFDKYKSNGDLKNILIKCSVLNDFYSTNIFKIYDVACHIKSLNIDEKLISGDASIVNAIATNIIEGKDGPKKKYFYSFATKYCSHHKPDMYPIYDSYVDKMLRHFRNVDQFYIFNDKDLKDYPKYKIIYETFISFYNLEKYNFKDIDKYLWQAGKFYFGKDSVNIDDK